MKRMKKNKIPHQNLQQETRTITSENQILVEDFVLAFISNTFVQVKHKRFK